MHHRHDMCVIPVVPKGNVEIGIVRNNPRVGDVKSYLLHDLVLIGFKDS